MNDNITVINKDTFWALIQEAKDACGQDNDAWAKYMIDRLVGLGPEQSLMFHTYMYAYKLLAHQYGLWDAAKIFRVDGCSDDSFSYFRSWLIVQGKDVYMAALADPDSLADVEPYADCFFETAGYVGSYAYEKLTGRNGYEDLDENVLLPALLDELAKDIHYKEGIEYPRDWKALPAFIPRLCAKYPYQYELQQEGCDWNCDLKEIRDLLAAGRKFDSEHGNKKKARHEKGGDAR